MFDQSYANLPAVILGTGPSLTKQKERILDLKSQGKIRIFGVNKTYLDFPVDVLICCDEKFHYFYGKIEGPFDHWHWDKDICEKGGYRYIEGRWEAGLSTDPSYINYGHSSGYQALGLAYHYGHREIYLAGYDMAYSGSRHYFNDLSDVAGEYPEPLRKSSRMDKPETKGRPPKELGLFQYYETVAEQNPCNIYNMTEGSALKCFPFKQL